MSGKNVVPEAKDALNRFKMEAASEKGVQLHIKRKRSTYLTQIFKEKITECWCLITS